MKLQPYQEIIKLSEEKLNETMAPLRAKRMKSKAQLEMAKLEEKIAEKQDKVQEMCLDKDINFDKLLDSLDETALLERRKDQYDEVLKQLFPKP